MGFPRGTRPKGNAKIFKKRKEAKTREHQEKQKKRRDKIKNHTRKN